MDIAELAIVGGMITPVYIALFEIYRKIGKYEEVCREFNAHILKGDM